MPSLVDAWTTEFEKLRERARAIAAGELGRMPPAEPTKKEVEGQKGGPFVGLPTFQYSETTISLFMECFAP
ncbi:hypothetical protein H6P81_020967 [Aristolochia fimbriata]|uniref:Uncharacterized protein n=1 Tax=Aristolochia fimbriata TaxID=158543 RepID=A0AAV7E0A1_ARIFI|nr:hypothetical protein H6P81_020967 [Aristolochia fimbriata]